MTDPASGSKGRRRRVFNKDEGRYLTEEEIDAMMRLPGAPDLSGGARDDGQSESPQLGAEWSAEVAEGRLAQQQADERKTQLDEDRRLAEAVVAEERANRGAEASDEDE